MPSIFFWNALQYTGNDGGTDDFGSLDIPLVISVAGQPYQNKADSLAQGSIFKLWDINQGPTDFKMAYIVSDVGDSSNGFVILEQVTDLNGISGIEYSTIALAAGIPYVLGSSQSYANYSAGFGGGTLSAIQSLKVKNLNSTAANVTLWLAL